MLKCLSTCFHQWEIPVVSIRLPLVWKSIGKWLFNFLIHISKYFLDDFKASLAIFVLMNIKDAVFVNWSSFSNCTSLTDECAASLSFSVRAALHPYHPVPIKQLGNNNKAHFKPLQRDEVATSYIHLYTIYDSTHNWNTTHCLGICSILHAAIPESNWEYK